MQNCSYNWLFTWVVNITYAQGSTHYESSNVIEGEMSCMMPCDYVMSRKLRTLSYKALWTLFSFDLKECWDTLSELGANWVSLPRGLGMTYVCGIQHCHLLLHLYSWAKRHGDIVKLKGLDPVAYVILAMRASLEYLMRTHGVRTI